jgi:flagellar basal-body rod protein FlgF
MDKMLYVAMSGARETMHSMAANSNNLANVNTTGFKADLNQFRSQQVFGPGYESRAYAMSERPAVDLAPGAMIQTGRSLDVAVATEGFLAVQSPQGGEAYTRKGNMVVNQVGQLLTGGGLPVIGDDGPIALPPGRVNIADDGTVSVTPLEGGEDLLIDRIKLVKPDAKKLEKGEDGLFRLNDGTQPAANAEVTLVSGMLESSNVNVVDAMVNMISLSRHFDMQVKMMKTTEELERSSDALLRLG